MAEIDAFFKLMHNQGASDLHLASGQVPALRLHGDIERIKYEHLTTDQLRLLLYEITPQEKIKIFEETGDVDFGYEVSGLARYRVNYFMQERGISAVFREIPSKIMTVEELELPPVISKLAILSKGLVLVTGPTGSGKSTTLAAIIDKANRTRKDHIITVEDPIEFIHTSRKCLVSQREVGLHSQTFSTALRGALHQDPDIIMLGELRDKESIFLSIEAASTGHLVFATLHTSSAARTVDRIIEIFSPDEQSAIRSSLADNLRAVVAQVLFKRLDQINSNNKGMCAAVEILIATPAVRNLIRESKTHQIPSIMQTGGQYGMRLMDDAIMDLYRQGKISPDEAYTKAENKSIFRPYLKKIASDFTEI